MCHNSDLQPNSAGISCVCTDILTSLLLAKFLLGKTGGLDWLFRKSFKELKALEEEPNPKTEAGSGLLAGFSGSTNDFSLPFHSALMELGSSRAAPKAPASLKSWAVPLPKQTSQEIELCVELRCWGSLSLQDTQCLAQQ